MKLYHFAPAHLVDLILKDGLTLGKIPIVDQDGYLESFIEPCQWLTDDGNWDTQSWATTNVISYDRTATRLLIVIPKAHRRSLWRAQDYLPHLPGETKRLITDWEGSEHWYMFFGKVPSGWIRKVEQRADMEDTKTLAT